VLADLDGRPMIEHVYRRVSAARGLSQVIVATDDLRIATRVHDFGGKVRLTKATHVSGTDRLAEVAASMDCDVVVNVQGDEPLIDPRAIDELTAPFAADPTTTAVSTALSFRICSRFVPSTCRRGRSPWRRRAAARCPRCTSSRRSRSGCR